MFDSTFHQIKTTFCSATRILSVARRISSMAACKANPGHVLSFEGRGAIFKSRPDNIMSGKNLASFELIEFGNNSIFVLTTPGGFYPFPF